MRKRDKALIDVSIIIVNYYSHEMIRNCVASIVKRTQDLSYEILVVDNGSDPENQKWLRENACTEFRWITSPDNIGFGRANNLGAKEAGGKYLLFLNPDTLLLNNAIKVMRDHLEEHGSVGAVGGALYSEDQKRIPSYCLNFDDPNDECRAARWGSIIGERIAARLKGGKQDSSDPERETEAAYVFGADMMMPKDLFLELRGFDPEFFMYAEEEELSWRIRKRGYRIVYLPQAKIVHLEEGTQKSESGFREQTFRMRMRGKLLFFHKCYGEEGMHMFCRARFQKYARLERLARLRGRKEEASLELRMQQCLKEEYAKYCKEKELIVKNG